MIVLLMYLNHGQITMIRDLDEPDYLIRHPIPQRSVSTTDINEHQFSQLGEYFTSSILQGSVPGTFF